MRRGLALAAALAISTWSGTANAAASPDSGSAPAIRHSAAPQAQPKAAAPVEDAELAALSDEEMRSTKGEWSYIAAVGAAVAIWYNYYIPFWEADHAGHGHRTAKHIHYWNGWLPYLEFHHWE